MILILITKFIYSMQAIVLSKSGSSSNLKIQQVPDPIPRSKEVLIKHKAIGINFLDICFRRAQYPLDEFPAILGLEGCGYIEKIGSEVVDYKVGDRVAYATAGFGSYAEKRTVDQNLLIKVPNELSDTVVAGTLFKGLMAHALLNRVFIAVRAKRILIHSVAGGVGHIMCQLAKYYGLEIFGTVGSDDKIPLATSFGCKHVINYKKNNFVEEIAKLTNNQGVGIVYDGVGKDNVNKSMKCLWQMGVCVSYGESAGKIEKFDCDLMIANSLYFTRPLMTMYKAHRAELALSADEVFASLIKGIVRPQIKEYEFKDIVKAHNDLENRTSVGSLVLKL